MKDLERSTRNSQTRKFFSEYNSLLVGLIEESGMSADDILSYIRTKLHNNQISLYQVRKFIYRLNRQGRFEAQRRQIKRKEGVARRRRVVSMYKEVKREKDRGQFQGDIYYEVAKRLGGDMNKNKVASAINTSRLNENI